jgi:hypothetical protein
MCKATSALERILKCFKKVNDILVRILVVLIEGSARTGWDNEDNLWAKGGISWDE